MYRLLAPAVAVLSLTVLCPSPVSGDTMPMQVAAEPPPVGATPLSALLASHAGRPLLINFWASWCEPCRAEMHALQMLADRGTVVLTVAVADREADVRDFLDESGLRLPVVHDRDQHIAKAWRARMLPYSVVLDSRHRIVARASGVVEWNSAAVDERLKRLMR
ncbi:TlpA family protein disulfide reductase [Methyloversatilis sp.]|uniref:TlpA family protein disulfide reductase n=1 Tax=Methyloversatilis sp. TaxID=2569862 RepID=UPI0035B20DCA